ncbi:MAG: hypothetical protein MZV63_03185 [Marinilabiliales bacterium]|nr:hypothetical protein [Marinilabiliales bacterium]
MPDSVQYQELTNIIYPAGKDPFAEGSSWYLYGDIDIDKMNEACIYPAATYLILQCFSKLHSDTKTNICRIYEAVWNSSDKEIDIYDKG